MWYNYNHLELLNRITRIFHIMTLFLDVLFKPTFSLILSGCIIAILKPVKVIHLHQLMKKCHLPPFFIHHSFSLIFFMPIVRLLYAWTSMMNASQFEHKIRLVVLDALNQIRNRDLGNIQVTTTD